ncbi:hypothetical protein H0H92_007212 [Tricholoma furcatifolium]|nr:hypothetical protein H0H92_007212 [Tricholoma furcatifolium]
MAGLLEWSNTIRHAMANDPGRHIFQDQLNTHGFIFLNDYLDNILSGPTQDPLIELVKTPGRKKTAYKKLKGLPSFQRGLTTLNEDNAEIHTSTSSLNTFHRELLQVAKDRPSQATVLPATTQQGGDIFNVSPVNPSDLEYPTTSAHPLGGLSEQNDLSVIAEDDETPDPTTSSGRSPRSPAPAFSLSESMEEHKMRVHTISVPFDEPLPPATMTESSSDVFHSVTLDTPPQSSPDQANIPTQYSVLPKMFETPAPITEGRDAPSDEALPLDSVTEKSTETALTTSSMNSNPSVERDFEIPLCDQNEVPAAGDKFPGSSFPPLPAPLPLRKSVRIPLDPSVGTGHHTVATPSIQAGGKRTSWLKKAREVKALEVAIKHSNTPLPPAPEPQFVGVYKRKSSEVTGSDDEGRHPKSSKGDIMDEAPIRATPDSSQHMEVSHQQSPRPIGPKQAEGQDGVLDRFKRTVEDLGARVGKGMSKSLGVVAATSALAEARAAAEARVAERHHEEEKKTKTLDLAPTSLSPAVNSPIPDVTSALPSTARLLSTTASITTISEDAKPCNAISEERRLSISDLFPLKDSSIKMKNKSSRTITAISSRAPTASPEPSQAAISTSSAGEDKWKRESTTTTPPDSPTASRPACLTQPTTAIFSKPPPVFIPPMTTSKPLFPEYGVGLPLNNTFSMPASMSLGIGSRLASPPTSKYLEVVSRHSTSDNVDSDKIFDDTEGTAWLTETQDTDHSSRYQSLPQRDLDQAYPSPTRKEFDTPHQQDLVNNKSPRIDAHTILESLQVDKELEDIISHKNSTATYPEKISRSENQISLSSSQSSQSHPGFLGQASKLFNNALGTSKKGTSDIKKVLQMAAVAAKKQQEENDKKVARLKEMENRRQLAVQRKAEEEKARTHEQERKMKEDGERRKREREETTERRPLKLAAKKEDDNTKKRKLTNADNEKKEAKKPPPKAIPKPLPSRPPTALSSSAAYNASLQSTTTSSSTGDSKLSKLSTPASSTFQKGKAKAATSTFIAEDDVSLPSQLVQIQMAARAKAQLQAAHLVAEPPVASESIELPEINSEYSDSDDEDRPKAFPGWAQSPELRQALQLQSTINPDDIFGAIRPLRMEEMFKTRTSRFRARTSSANWTGTDQLTREEEQNYAKRMGFN